MGVLPFLFKLFVFGFPLTADETVNVWNVEARVRFEALNKPVKVSVFIPGNTKHYVISDENFISRGYGLTTIPEEGNRLATWSIRKARGTQVLYYKATMRRIKREEPEKKIKKPQIESSGFEGRNLAAAESVLSVIRSRSADVHTLVSELLSILNQPTSNDNISLLLGKDTAMINKMELAVRILAHEGIPARIVHGIQLKELQRESKILHWLEVYDNNSWHSFDPQTGIAMIPDDYLPWWRSKWPLAKITGADKLHVRLSVNLNKEAALYGAIERGRVLAPYFFDFSLFSLPIETQTVYHVLLLIPVGAFILVIFRNVIGIKTFGTFMPVLIALAFRETQLLWGILLFSGIIAVGLSIRFYFEQLKLLLVPRLASILTVVALLMAFMSVIGHKLGLERGLSVALFPMVILTMTIERMSIVWEERGPGEALQQGMGSLLVAALGYMVMTNRFVEHFIFVFPEVLLILLAGTILMGRYSGYRLVELFRFRSLVGEKK